MFSFQVRTIFYPSTIAEDNLDDAFQDPAPLKIQACLSHAEITLDDRMRTFLIANAEENQTPSRFDVWMHSQLLAPSGQDLGFQTS